MVTRAAEAFPKKKKSQFVQYKEGDVLVVNGRLVRVELTNVGWKYIEVEK